MLKLFVPNLRWRELPICHWALLLLALLASSSALCAVVQLRDALAVVSQSGNTERYPVQLPYRWDVLNAAEQGTAEFELAFNLAQSHDQAYAVYLARSGNAYEVWLNGRLLARSGELEDFNSSDFSQTPQLFTVPSGLMGSENLFRIHIRADMGRHAGLSVVQIGPEREVRPLYEAAYAAQVTSAQVVAMVCAFTALLAGTLWATQPRQALGAAGVSGAAPQILFGWATLALLGWGLRVLSETIESPSLRWPWWGFVVLACDGMGMVCLTVFCQSLLSSRLPPMGKYSVWLAAGFIAFEVGSAMLAYFLKWPNLWIYSISAFKIGFGLYALYFIWAARRSRSRAAKLMAATMAASLLLVGFGRWYSHVQGELNGNAAFTHYALFLLCGAVGAMVVQRFRNMRLQADALAHSLRSQLQAKEAQLAASYVQIEQAARGQARSSERSRILRDMHDGVGAQLATAIGQLQMPSTAALATDSERTAALLPILNESLDQLKLSVDALELPSGDINALLAAMRYRLEPRLRAAGLGLVWEVQQLPVLPNLDRPAMQQLQFLVYELLSNAMQHAKADQIMVHAHCRASGVGAGSSTQVLVLTISDNGQGLPADFDWHDAQRAGLGLRSLGARGEAFGASWQILSPGSSQLDGYALQGMAVQFTWAIL